MSRTIRRRNIGNWDKQWYINKLERVNKSLGCYEWVKQKGKALKKANKKYHSDATKTMEHVPKWFRQDINRAYRAKSKRVLRKLNSDQRIVDEIVFPRLRNTVRWEWW